MDIDLARVLFANFGLYYATFDSADDVVSIDGKLLLFFRQESSPCRLNLYDLLPELIGMEDVIGQAKSGELSAYTLYEIMRSPGDDIYFNIHLFPNRGNGALLLVIVEDITRQCVFRQSMQQTRNEVILLKQALTIKNAALESANNELVVAEKELRTLNRDLEAKVSKRTIELEHSVQLSRRLLEQTVNALAYALEKRDPYTAGHQRSVALLACAIARELDMSEKDIEGINYAGSLHDIGKIYVPSDFLTKPTLLTEEEVGVIRTHPKIGFEILRDIEFPWPIAAMVLQHHERLDGSGYPYGLEGDEIHFESRILAVADVVEAMGTNRPYRISPGLDRAIEEIANNAAKLYDKDVVAACIRLITKKGFTLG